MSPFYLGGSFNITFNDLSGVDPVSVSFDATPNQIRNKIIEQLPSLKRSLAIYDLTYKYNNERSLQFIFSEEAPNISILNNDLTG